MREEAKATPAMARYLEIKEQYPDCLVFYRMGDFYELFFEDAVTASKVLNIVLTSRGKCEDKKIDMCGIPFHAYESYLVRLVKAGYKVAICEQTETPAEAKKRGSGAVVTREVVRVVTAGTLTEDTLLDVKKNNYLGCVVKNVEGMGFAWCDISTGNLYVREVNTQNLFSVLSGVVVSELLLTQEFFEANRSVLEGEFSKTLSFLPRERFSFVNNKQRAESFFGVQSLSCFGSFSKSEITAIGVLLDYISLTQKGKVPKILPPQKLSDGMFMEIDAATRKSLELTTALSDEKNSKSVRDVLDRTITGMGARYLTVQLASPLTDIALINDRLDKIDFFLQNQSVRENIRTHLRRVPDIERSLSRLAVGRGGPRDLKLIAVGLSQVPALRLGMQAAFVPPAIFENQTKLGDHTELVQEISNALKEDDLPLLARDGNFIRRGYSSVLDEIWDKQKNAQRTLLELQERYVSETGISNLKITFNNLLGYFIEVPLKQGDVLLNDKSLGFIHRQTMKNVMRFTTIALTEIEDGIVNAQERARDHELKIFEHLCARVLEHSSLIMTAAFGIAEIDVASSLAELSEENVWVRPILTAGTDFVIKGGRHPVVENALKKEHRQFIPNSCVLGEKSNSLWLLTGPNIAGKSTFLRQNALIAVLAQMGSFVPAEYAKIGLVDKLFSRVGASDDLARGRSTFMVEMVEVATILNGATERSLVILDEVGRGTATFDGLSLAWAVVEYLHEKNKCRGLFATHYHELTVLANRLENVTLHSMKVKEWEGDIIFLHEVGEGASDRSYGIHVAKLAGLPHSVLMRATQVLDQLEEKKQQQKPLFDDLPLFSSMSSSICQHESEVENELKKLDVDSLSPREALDLLYHLKKQAEKNE